MARAERARRGAKLNGLYLFIIMFIKNMDLYILYLHLHAKRPSSSIEICTYSNGGDGGREGGAVHVSYQHIGQWLAQSYVAY